MEDINMIFPFGKYKGQLVKNFVAIDYRYIIWFNSIHKLPKEIVDKAVHYSTSTLRGDTRSKRKYSRHEDWDNLELDATYPHY